MSMLVSIDISKSKQGGLFLDDDLVVLTDLTPLWDVDMNGTVNGAVETWTRGGGCVRIIPMISVDAVQVVDFVAEEKTQTSSTFVGEMQSVDLKLYYQC
ncbi:probable galacturonosyltransferase 12 [Tanacetum coccineum]